MTMTETHLATKAHGAASADLVASVTDWATTTDHRRIGRVFALSGLLAGLATLVLWVLIAAERIDPEALAIFTNSGSYPAATLARLALAFLVVAPALLGVAIAVVPLQIGAPNVAFPRAAAMAYTTWLGGAVLLVGSVVANGGAGGSSNWNFQLFLVGLGLAVFGLLIAALTVVATVLSLRAPGLTLDRVPLFSFASFVAATVMLLSWSVLLANLVNLYVSHRYGQVPFGNSTKAMGYIDWAITHPGVTVFALPALGFAADAIATFAKTRQPLRSVLLVAIGLGGLLSFAGDVQRAMFPDISYRPLMVLVSLGTVLPFLLVLGLAGLSLKSGKPAFGAPLAFAVASLLAGLLGAAMSVLLPFSRLGLLDPQGVSVDGARIVPSSIYPAAQANVMLIAGLLGACGALAYWGPRLWGRKMADKAAAPLALLGLGSAALVGIPEAIAAFSDQPIDELSFASSSTLQLLNGIAAAGYGLGALALLGFLGVALKGFAKGDAAGTDPWGGQSLEWAADGSNATIVRSAQPLFDRKDA